MSSKPLIAVTADFREFEPYFWHCVPQPYIDAAADVAEVLPIILPALGARLTPDELLDRVEGILITGARSNVHPSNYGEIETEGHEPFDRTRDETNLPLIRRAIERGVPLLAICRGIQELNVALGGTLTAQFQKVENKPDHRYRDVPDNDVKFEIAHGLKIAEGSCIANILQDDMSRGPVEVNSVHMQALHKLGENVVVEATAEDGTIEAISISGAPGFVVGVQWHPEYWATTDSPSNSIFKAYGNAVRSYADQKFNKSIAAE